MATLIDHQSRAHARLSGSVASIFTKCTGAPSLWKGRERKATAFTREGTAAHELADAILTGGNITLATIHVEGEQVEITDEMRAAVKTYVDYIKKLRAKTQWWAIEQRFVLDMLWHPHPAPEPMFGSSDFAGVRGTVLEVVDKKYGKGVPVSAERNAQLLYYATGVYLWLLQHRPDLAAKIRTVRLHIVQPRVSDTPSIWEITLLDLLMWAEEVLKKSVDDITAGNITFVAGSHCQFCLGRGVCPELAKEAMKAAKSKFPLVQPTQMTDEELGDALDRAELVSIWLNGVRNEVETRIKNGHDVPGWKLVAKKGYRQWTDEDNVAHYLTAKTGEVSSVFFADPKPLSPAQAENKLKALGHDPRIVDQFVTIPVTGTTLVPETDKRAAVVTGPQNVFTPVE